MLITGYQRILRLGKFMHTCGTRIRNVENLSITSLFRCVGQSSVSLSVPEPEVRQIKAYHKLYRCSYKVFNVPHYFNLCNSFSYDDITESDASCINSDSMRYLVDRSLPYSLILFIFFKLQPISATNLQSLPSLIKSAIMGWFSDGKIISVFSSRLC